MDNIQAALDAGAALGTVHELDSGRFVVVPDGYQVEDLELFQENPRHARGVYVSHSLESFLIYFHRFGDANSMIFCDMETNKLAARLNHHEESGKARHGDHKAIYKAPYSLEWKRWKEANGVKMSQIDFAYFMEENASDVVEPDAATMIEVSQSLKATKKGQFVSDQRLANGSVQFTYEEHIDATTGRKKLQVPENFTIGIPIFYGGPGYKLEARLRFRIKDDGSLVMWFDLHRAMHAERQAFEDVVEKVRADVKDDMRVIHGVFD